MKREFIRRSVKGKRPKPLVSFRFYPGQSFTGKTGLYFGVVVFRTLREMRKHAKHVNDAKFSVRNTLGLVQGWTRYHFFDGKQVGVYKEMGEIVLAQRHCGVRIVSHEVTHAMLRWAERKKLDQKWLRGEGNKKNGLVSADVEEPMCYAVGDMCAQIYDRLWSSEVIKAA